MGTPAFAVPPLRVLLGAGFEIPAVVTVPDKPSGRGLQVHESEVKKFAEEKKLRIIQPVNLKDNSFIDELKKIQPDLIVVVAFRILPKEVFTLPKFGSVNLHASLLPKYRGAAPINWAIINGEKVTGVTTFFLKEKIDTGNIIAQKKCLIEDEDNAGTIHDKLTSIGAELLLESVQQIQNLNGNIKLETQKESDVSFAPKITKKVCRINWSESGERIHNLIRGLSPYPCAYSLLDDKAVKIFRSKVDSENLQANEAGKIFLSGGKLLVSTNNGSMEHGVFSAIEILELQLEGRNKVSAKDFINGYPNLDQKIFF